MSNLRVITAEEFPTIIAAGATLVDFGAPWCGPCKALEPVLVQLGEELAGKLAIVKVDVDATPDLAAMLGVMSVPALHLYKDGMKIAAKTGGQSKAQLLEFVAPAL